MPRSAKAQPAGLVLPDLPDAACAGDDPEGWFSSDPATMAAAEAICAGCNERTPCGLWADQHRVQAIHEHYTHRAAAKYRDAANQLAAHIESAAL